jgi:hypothetical protein
MTPSFLSPGGRGLSRYFPYQPGLAQSDGMKGEYSRPESLPTIILGAPNHLGVGFFR